MNKFDLHQRRKELGLTLEDIGKYVGVSKSTVKKWETGYIENMKRDKIALLADILQTSPLLIMGYDAPAKSIANDITPSLFERYNPKIHKIPVLGTIAAGIPLYAEQHIEDYTYTDRNHGAEYFALRVKGDSMNAASINEGSLLIVRRQENVENGEIAVVMVNNENATVKRFKKDGNIIQLIPQSYNPEHQIQIYDATQDKICIVGKVVECKMEF